MAISSDIATLESRKGTAALRCPMCIELPMSGDNYAKQTCGKLFEFPTGYLRIKSKEINKNSEFSTGAIGLDEP